MIGAILGFPITAGFALPHAAAIAKVDGGAVLVQAVPDLSAAAAQERKWEEQRSRQKLQEEAIEANRREAERQYDRELEERSCCARRPPHTPEQVRQEEEDKRRVEARIREQRQAEIDDEAKRRVRAGNGRQ